MCIHQRDSDIDKFTVLDVLVHPHHAVVESALRTAEPVQVKGHDTVFRRGNSVSFESMIKNFVNFRQLFLKFRIEIGAVGLLIDEA